MNPFEAREKRALGKAARSLFLRLGIVLGILVGVALLEMSCGKANAESTVQGPEITYGVETKVEGVNGLYILEVNGHEYLRTYAYGGQLIHSASCKRDR